ncbi:bile acid:sodium symporter family protein [Dietzia alimentaria]|uniref:bile acid:sodium symporter family protein n=1 Tax=Dietzia alimentaria TaxID=665550 RepID=UPI00029AB5DA|nr:bile acid:sodium symporter [Dietzia alimentaria]
MTDFFRDLAQFFVPVFVISSMLNVGLTQRPTKLVEHLSNWHYLVRMVVVNLLVVPAVMVFALELVDVAPAYESALVLFGMCAGAPFLIKLTRASQRDLALGATVLLVLMTATVVIVPLLLPRLIEGLDVDAWAIARALLLQMIAPMIGGMILAEVVTSVSAWIQPWVARLSSIALYVLLGSTIIGFGGEMGDRDLWKAIALGLVVLAVAFMLGFMMGDGRDHLKDVGGLSTAQRGMPAAVIVATSNFDDTRVFVLVNVLNVIGIIGLLVVAKILSRDNRIELTPTGADPPRRDRDRGTRRVTAPD